MNDSIRSIANGWKPLLAFLLLISMGIPASVHAQLIVVVAKSSNQKATVSDVQEIYSGYRLAWNNGKAIHVVDQPETNIGSQFYAKVMKQKTNQVWIEWTRLVLSGQADAPQKAKDDAAVKSAVAANPLAIGYISLASLDDSVREIARIP